MPDGCAWPAAEGTRRGGGGWGGGGSAIIKVGIMSTSGPGASAKERERPPVRQTTSSEPMKGGCCLGRAATRPASLPHPPSSPPAIPRQRRRPHATVPLSLVALPPPTDRTRTTDQDAAAHPTRQSRRPPSSRPYRNTPLTATPIAPRGGHSPVDTPLERHGGGCKSWQWNAAPWGLSAVHRAVGHVGHRQDGGPASGGVGMADAGAVVGELREGWRPATRRGTSTGLQARAEAAPRVGRAPAAPTVVGR